MTKQTIVAASAAMLLGVGAVRCLAEETAVDIGRWRTHFTWGAQPVRSESGDLAHVNMDFSLFREIKEDGERTGWALRAVEPHRTPPPASEWTAVGHDDSKWPWFSLPLRSGDPERGPGRYRSITRLAMRGRFVAEDPARVGDLKLTVRYVGGVAVHFNGREIARGHLPAGELTELTVAEDYGPQAFLDDKGAPLRHRGWQELEAHRVRTLTVAIPVAHIQEGANVLALDVHGAALPEKDLLRNPAFFPKGNPTSQHDSDLRTRHLWALSGVAEAKLTAAGGQGFRDASCRAGGVRVWNQPISETVRASDYAPPGEPLFPVSISAPKGGAFSGQVVLGATEPMRGLTAEVSDLVGPNGAVLPAARIETRWGLPDGHIGRRDPPWFDGLEETPPEETPFFDQFKASLQPVWFTARVPGDARPGEYRGTATLRMAGGNAVEIPIHLRVADWTLPDRPFATMLDAVQSPESVAMFYDTPLWSARHWRLLNRSFKRLAEAGGNAITLTLIRRTHFGNEHGMVVWDRQPDGSLVPDLSVAERYIRTAVRHMGRIPVVILYVWEVGGTTRHGDGMGNINMDREILVSIRDPNTGLLEDGRGPDWGTQECVDFWRPALAGIRDILARHDMAESLMIGVAGDRRPTDPAVKSLAAAAPYAPWYVHSHYPATSIHGQRVAYWSSVWGSSPQHPDHPSAKRAPSFQRWGDGQMRASFPRQQINPRSPPGWHRLMTERLVLEGDKRGFGRMGADFWGVLETRATRFGFDATRVGDEWRINLSSRYPESEWMNLGLSYTVPALLAPGRAGALSTVRLEAIGETVQENEARFLLERMLADSDQRARLDPDLAARCQAILDERARMVMPDHDMRRVRAIYDSGFRDRSERLFLLAAEAAKAVAP